MDLSFTSLAVVAVVALVAPLALGLTGLRLPAIVLEILLGIAVGPQGLNWAHVDRPVEVMSLIGLAFLLLLAGLEVEYDRFRGRLLRLTALGYAISFGLALLVGLALRAGDLVKSPLLKDAGAPATPFGQVVIAGASIAEVVPIVLLSLFFSGEAGGIGSKLVLLIGFGVFVLSVGVAIFAAEHSMRLSSTLLKLHDTTAEIRVRGAFVLLAIFVVDRKSTRL